MGKGSLNTQGNSSEHLIRTLGDVEELVVCRGARAWYWLDVDKPEGVPDALGIRALVPDCEQEKWAKMLPAAFSLRLRYTLSCFWYLSVIWLLKITVACGSGSLLP
jgi:hypothetical protein